MYRNSGNCFENVGSPTYIVRLLQALPYVQFSTMELELYFPNLESSRKEHFSSHMYIKRTN
jgi:hypothetical protein